MSHEIQELDYVYSNQGTEWHGLAQVRATINRQAIEPVLFPLISLPHIAGLAPDGSPVRLDGFQAVVADLRSRNGSTPWQPLAIHSDAYQTIPNERIWDAIQSAMRNHKHVITTVGTLGNLRRFFVSVALDGAEGFTVGDGDKFLSHLNFVTSHDGSLALQSYDSNIRIVCQNTLNWSLQAQGSFRLHVKHTSGASVAIDEMSRIIDETLRQRVELKSRLETLRTLPVRDPRAVFAAWKFLQQGSPKEFGTPTKNTIMRLADGFTQGTGCRGETLYDCFNSVTEYYTTGKGAGATTTNAQRVSSAQFGGAAAQKVDFTHRITTDEGRQSLRDVAKAAVALLS